ncbi:MAG: non-canonical purine NTP diphosphatase [Bacteroidales bacterium]|nr:non-canonical purine NTP diphosphatase [Bacteroidales bacterium]
MKLVFASNNPHKLSEIRAMLGSEHDILSLHDIGCQADIPETAETLEGNALQKASYIYERYHCDCFADDTGLEVEALDGRPGVYTARYAGPQCSPEDNIVKLLHEMQGKVNRKAVFRTSICLILQGNVHVFNGIVKGSITEQKKGTDGFGYDPVFAPDETGLTFAEMGVGEKNKISHRARAIQQLKDFLLASRPETFNGNES